MILENSIQIIHNNSAGLMSAHYSYYRRLANMAGLPIVGTANNKSKYSIPYAEVDTNWNPRTPYSFCDKAQNQSIFSKAGFDTLRTKVLTSIDDIPEYSFIIKPISGAGSSDSKNLGTYKINPKTINKECIGTCVIQESIAEQNEEYIQLYVEGFVNNDSEVEFTSIHEIIFCDNVWIRQLDTKVTFKILSLLSKVKALLRDNNIGNCMFLLQFLRKSNEEIWYPTDWQYRLSYNMVFGKNTIEPEYCKSAMQFMVGNLTSVIPQKYKYYQGVVPFSRNNRSQFVVKMKEKNIVLVPSKSKAPNTVLIIAHGDTFADAKATFDSMLYE